MMKKSLRLFGLVMSLIMLFALFSGCNKSGDKQDATTTKATTKTTAAPTTTAPAAKETTTTTSEPARLKLFLRERWAGVGYDNPIWNKVQEDTNTVWDLTIVPGAELEQKLNITLAGRDIPDIMNISANDVLVYELGRDGILFPLNTVIDKMPNLAKNYAPIWDSYIQEDGNIYAINAAPKTYNGGVDFITMYRKDWLDKFGVGVPQTFDEYMALADAIVNRDPDGNSEKDTYAFGGLSNADSRYFDHIFSAYGVLPFNWTIENGELINMGIHPNAKEALRTMNRLYEMGAIDPEFITDNEDRIRAKFTKGVYGAPCYYHFIFDPNNIHGYRQEFKDANPDGEWIEGVIMKSDYSREGVGMRALSMRGWIWIAVGANTKEIDAITRLFDYLNTEEAIILQNYGFENEHYKIDENGTIVVTTDEAEIRAAGITQCYISFNWRNDHYAPEFLRINNYIASLGTLTAIDGLVIDKDIEALSVDINDYMRTQYLNIIVGNVPVDEGFEALLTEWQRRGGDQLTEAYNNAYKKTRQ